MEYWFWYICKRKQSNDTRNMKNVDFVLKDVQRLLSSHKISERQWTRGVLYKDLKNFAIFTGKHQCRSLFFNKNAGLQVYNFIKRRLQHRYFFDNTAKIWRTVILKNISERMFLKVFPFMLVWTFSYMNK